LPAKMYVDYVRVYRKVWYFWCSEKQKVLIKIITAFLCIATYCV